MEALRFVLLLDPAVAFVVAGRIPTLVESLTRLGGTIFDSHQIVLAARRVGFAHQRGVRGSRR